MAMAMAQWRKSASKAYHQWHGVICINESEISMAIMAYEYQQSMA
jgi:hypothetical protein